jgi:hypothetical protein
VPALMDPGQDDRRGAQPFADEHEGDRCQEAPPATEALMVHKFDAACSGIALSAFPFVCSNTHV